jgi:hypothetical protein
MATRLPYSVSENDIYTQIMRQMQQSRPAALANPYENFTGGYNPDLYNRPRQEGEGLGGMVPGLLDTGGGIGETSTTGASYSNPADAIAVGQAMQGYGKSFGGLAPGGFLSGLIGSGLVNAGISQLGAMEAAAAQAAADAAAMDALAGLSDASVGLGELGAIGAADIGAIGAMGLGLGAGDLGGLGAGDALGGYAGGTDLGAIGAMGLGLSAGDVAGIGGGTSGGDVSGGYGGVDSGGYSGDGAGGYYYKGGKVTMDGLLTNVDLPTPDDGYGALQAGEYVIKKSTVDKLGDKKLKALNEGRATIKMRK